MMKSICVIGAGPAGLVAAKTLIQRGYNVTIFEAFDRVGGMWRAQPGESGEKCGPEMRTNLSRYTVAFSDLSWSSVELSSSSSEPPMFPKAWHVGRYLQTYARKYGLDDCTNLNARIKIIRRMKDSGGWQVTWTDGKSGELSAANFDFLVVASGFFGQPATSFDPVSNGSSPNIVHSSRFRELSYLTEKAGKIAVIGGGISGSEAAAQAAFQISNARHAPGKKSKPVHAKSTIYHIINRPFYCLPRYLPQEVRRPDNDINPAPRFLPLDLAMYNLSRRGTGKISAAISTVPAEKAQKGHDYMRSVIGGDQSEVECPELVYTVDQTQYPGYTGITDTYTEFVRSGVIVPVRGWVDEVTVGHDLELCIKVTPKLPWAREEHDQAKVIDNVTGIIEATGYLPNLDFLDESVLALVDHDSSCPRVPLLLSRGSVFAKDLPTLAFVGFYEGPYWSVMEMQALLVADTWAKDDTIARNEAIYQQTEAAEMRRALKERSLQVPQFWMMDYLGLVEEFARLTGTERNDTTFGGQSGPIFPSRYAITPEDSDVAAVVKEVTDIMQATSTDTRFVAPAVFRGLQGAWLIQRRIASRTTTPGGTFSGTAHFHPRTPTDTTYAAEYLYIEEGTFAIDSGLSFPASRRYIYRYNEVSDRITSWFAAEDNEGVGALFNTWEFWHPSTEGLYGGWRARGSHWCDPDTYKNDCEFRFNGARLDKFGITYAAKGPNKDYSHESWYERARADRK